MTAKSRKRSAASEVLQKSETRSKVFLGASESSVLAPDQETKAKKPVRLTRAKAASIRKAIAMKAPASVKVPAAVKVPVAVKAPVTVRRPIVVKRQSLVRPQAVIGNLSFMTGKLAGKTSALFRKLKSLVKES